MNIISTTILFAFVLVVEVTAAYNNTNDEQALLDAFNNFTVSHGRRFRSTGERQIRFANFRKNREIMLTQNAEYEKGKSTYLTTLNDFSDLSLSDVIKQYTGAKLPVDQQLTPNEQAATEVLRVKRQTIPDNFVLSDYYPTVYHQGQCGSCWAFSALLAAEIKCNQLNVSSNSQSKSLLTLSKQQLVDCARNRINAGCEGGWPAYAWDYLNSAQGSCSESDYPYTVASSKQGVSGSCQKNKPIRARRYKYTNLPSLNPSYWKQQMYRTRSAISVAIKVVSPFQSYKNGVYKDSTVYGCTNVNHAVTIVGYGKNSTTGQEYWIVRNSWGSTWGDNGHIKMDINSNTLNVNCYGMMLTGCELA